jgi:hypothetical protein
MTVSTHNPLAQMVERLIYNRYVAGSSPVWYSLWGKSVRSFSGSIPVTILQGLSSQVVSSQVVSTLRNQEVREEGGYKNPG